MTTISSHYVHHLLPVTSLVEPIENHCHLFKYLQSRAQHQRNIMFLPVADRCPLLAIAIESHLVNTCHLIWLSYDHYTKLPGEDNVSSLDFLATVCTSLACMATQPTRSKHAMRLDCSIPMIYVQTHRMHTVCLCLCCTDAYAARTMKSWSAFSSEHSRHGF